VTHYSDVIARLDRAIQYAKAHPLEHRGSGYWMPGIKWGMTAESMTSIFQEKLQRSRGAIASELLA
jgi:hypothetical protein